MNIMLVSVTERTREIGIRKAIGATRRSILLQFLLESSAICLLGGAVGIVLAHLFGVAARAEDLASLVGVEPRLSGGGGQHLGVAVGLGGGVATSAIAGWRVIFTVAPIVIAFTCAFLTGIIFGYLPARKAARLDPIEALARD